MNGKTLDFVLMSFVRLPLPSFLGKSKQSIYFHLSMIHIMDELRETSTGSKCTFCTSHLQAQVHTLADFAFAGCVKLP